MEVRDEVAPFNSPVRWPGGVGRIRRVQQLQRLNHNFTDDFCCSESGCAGFAANQ
jgi:hypothetical protein